MSIGDADFIVNWYGVKRFALKMPWDHQEEFLGVPDQLWYPTPASKAAGELRYYDKLAFLRLFNASHMASESIFFVK
jgi:carboxypeptidase C (cathepsin A)